MFSISVLSQTTIDEVLNKYNDNSVPYINVDTLKKNAQQALILDAREIEEFEVSHLQDAQHIGFKNFNYSMMDKLMVDSLVDRDTLIIVYCSIGIRSEIIGKKLISHGFTNVYNLYGGLFEWVNKGGSVFCQGNITQKVHAYSKKWSRYLTKGFKVYE
jgi:rhodanese-related sulfurtransferase